MLVFSFCNPSRGPTSTMRTVSEFTRQAAEKRRRLEHTLSGSCRRERTRNIVRGAEYNGRLVRNEWECRRPRLCTGYMDSVFVCVDREGNSFPRWYLPSTISCLACVLSLPRRRMLRKRRGEHQCQCVARFKPA
jgi:hypothetical protein